MEDREDPVRGDLVIEPFEPLPKKVRGALMEEGEQLVRFVEADAASFAVRFVGR